MSGSPVLDSGAIALGYAAAEELRGLVCIRRTRAANIRPGSRMPETKKTAGDWVVGRPNPPRLCRRKRNGIAPKTE